MDPVLYLKGKTCTIHGLVKALHLNGQSCTIIKWLEEKKRMNVELNDGSQVCVKLDNFKMEGELEPLLWSAKIEDKMGKRIEKALQLAIPKQLLHNENPKKLYGFVAVAELEAIKKNDFSCCGKESCFEKATTCVSTPWFYQRIQDRPAMIVNIMCIPICGKSACDNEVRRQTDSLMKSVSKESRKNGSPGLLEGQRRICHMCKKMSNRKGEFKKCSGCNATFYCSKKCQLGDWKDHEQNCV